MSGDLPVTDGARGRVLVAGVFLVDRENVAAAIVEELATSEDWLIEQRWWALGDGATPDELKHVTVGRERAGSKFVLINRMLAETSINDYEFIIICDDDIRVPAGFVDRYLRIVSTYGFALAQPARTHDSYIDHTFVERLDGIDARWTRFVEIGPLFSVRRDAARVLLPFDEASPMGWGYDLVWPHVLERAGLKLGIVDAIPIEHKVRKAVAHYDYGSAKEQMERYLEAREHLSTARAFVIVESYVER